MNCTLIMATVLSCLGQDAAKNPVVELDTSLGKIAIELYADKAPASVKNFLAYVEKQHYNGTIFHRVIPKFMIQGGGFDTSMSQRKTDAPVKNEAKNGLKNLRGTVAMARTSAVDSATSQFFINHGDNEFLNHKSDREYGYAVFGRVIEGMDVVDKVAAVRTTTRAGHDDVPLEVIEIKTATLRK